jgi:tRNA A-37 threonylcarbamoyl transferase component Bud32
LHNFALDGYTVNGPLYEGSELTICYRGTLAYVIKGVRATDAQRLRLLRDTIAQAATAGAHAPRHVAPFELRSTPASRTYVIMPRYADTLERMPSFSDADAVATLWDHVSSALSDLHALGFAHGDVKPANVCVDHGEFWLIDLDSAARFGAVTQTTTAYLPVDERGVRVLASERADWWALAMTLAEKACGAAGLPLGCGARAWTASEVRVHLAKNLPLCVWTALAEYIK